MTTPGEIEIETHCVRCERAVAVCIPDAGEASAAIARMAQRGVVCERCATATKKKAAPEPAPARGDADEPPEKSSAPLPYRDD